MIWTFSKKAQRITHPATGSFPGWGCDARSNPVAGHTPIENGEYPFGPEGIIYSNLTDPADMRAYGPLFINANTTNGKGVHGGGTGSAQPLAPKQGWIQTEGCIRVQNADLYHIALNIRHGDYLKVTD
jgi:hypothetical protein